MVMMIMMMVPIHTKMFLRFESLLRSSLIENNPWVDCVGGFRGWIPWVDSRFSLLEMQSKNETSKWIAMY